MFAQIKVRCREAHPVLELSAAKLSLTYDLGRLRNSLLFRVLINYNSNCKWKSSPRSTTSESKIRNVVRIQLASYQRSPFWLWVSRSLFTDRHINPLCIGHWNCEM